MYLNELVRKKNTGCKEVEVTALPVAKMGHPLLIREKCDKEVQEYVMALCEEGTVVNTVIVKLAGTAILRRRNPGLLASTRSDDDGVVLMKDWARYLLQRMGFVKQKATTKAKNTVSQACNRNFLGPIFFHSPATDRNIFKSSLVKVYYQLGWNFFQGHHHLNLK